MKRLIPLAAAFALAFAGIAASAGASTPITIIQTVTYPGQPAPVTARQARQALLDGAWATQRAQVACKPAGRAQVCLATDSTTYIDTVFGPSRISGTSTFKVSRHGHDYRVRVVVPDHFDIYAG